MEMRLDGNKWGWEGWGELFWWGWRRWDVMGLRGGGCAGVLTVASTLQEAFFGKALMDLSRKALLAAGGVGDGAARPSLAQGAPRHKGDPNVAGALQGTPLERRETPTHPRGESRLGNVSPSSEGLMKV